MSSSWKGDVHGKAGAGYAFKADGVGVVGLRTYIPMFEAPLGLA